jgi:peptidoglycan/LPS O-acetylase OafA/YrhL
MSVGLLKTPGEGSGIEPERADKPRGSHAGLVVLDALRGLAALYVVCSHCAILLLVSFNQARALDLPAAMKLLAATSYLFAFGHQAVILFFVLSGFVIHLRQAQKIHAGGDSGRKFDVKSYLIRRLRRIVPPFYFALLLTFVLDLAVRAVNPAFAVPKTGNPIADEILVQHIDWPTLRGNLVFLQWLTCATWGNNTALWSLAYEFYLYLLYPVFWLLRTRIGVKASTLAVFGVSALASGLVLHWHIMKWPLFVLIYWFCWVLGAWAAEEYVAEGRVMRSAARAPLVAALGVAWLATFRLNPLILSDTFGAVCCSLLVLLAIRMFASAEKDTLRHAWLHRFARVGDFSYSLYLTHIPVLAVVWALWFQWRHAMPSQPFVAVIGFFLALAVGRASYELVEKRFINHPRIRRAEASQ